MFKIEDVYFDELDYFFNYEFDFPNDETFPLDNKQKEIDTGYCSCNNRKETKVLIMNEVVYVCKKADGGCGREIKK